MISSISHCAYRPNIMFSVCLCARFQKEPREVHLSAVKHIFKYLIGTSNLGLCFKREKAYRLLGYYNADFLEIEWKERALVGDVASLVDIWFLGQARNRGQ